MADRTVTVKSSGGDYASLHAAFVGEDGYNCVTNTGQLYIDCYNFEDTVQCNITASITTSATYRVVIRLIDDPGGVYSTSAYRMVGATTRIVNNTIHYLMIEAMQWQITSAGANAYGYQAASGLDAAGQTEIDKAIYVGAGSATAGGFINNSEPLHDIWIRNSIGWGGYRGLSSAGSGSKIIADNVTLDDFDTGVYVNYGGHKLTNCRITGCTTVVATGGGNIDAASDYNLTDGTAPTNWGADSIAGVDAPTIDYVDDTNATLTSRDYHLNSASDSGDSAGTNLSGTFTDDIDGDTRTKWSIGADDGVAASQDVTVPVGSVTATGYAPTASVTTTPSPPTAVSAVSASTSSVTLTWTKNAADDDVHVWYKLASDTEWTLYDTITDGSESATVYWLAAGALYDFAVSHFSGAAESAFAADDATTWCDPGTGAATLTGYAPTASVANNQAVEIPVGSMTATGYAPTVAGANDAAVTVPVGSVTLAGLVPDATVGTLLPVTGLTATVSNDSIELDWTDTNGGSVPYRVYYLRTNVDTSYTLWATTAPGAETETIDWLVGGAGYTIKVVAYDDPDEGPPAYTSATAGTVRAIAAAFV